MAVDPNHDIVPSLRMFDGLISGLAADEIERLRNLIEQQADEIRESRHLLQRARVKLLDWQRMYETWLVKHPNALPPCKHIELLEEIEEYLKNG